MVGCQTLESGTEVVRAEEAEVDTLIVAIQSDVDTVRDSALRGLQALIPALPKSGEVFDNLVRRVWVAKCDPAPETRELAEKLWKSAGLAVDSSLGLLEDVAILLPLSGRQLVRPLHLFLLIMENKLVRC